ncbi:MAG: L-lactate dehydrogenase complex protein LldF [Candidatus Paceibacteria bacterium]|jgi:L-lactate dehydrogenase complex protein LldF
MTPDARDPIPSLESFPANVRSALRNDGQREALRHATSLIHMRRGEAVERVPDWQELRTHAKEIKAATLANLDHWLERFEQNAKANGTQVHWAQTSEEANDIIADIAARSNAQTLVKSKSMTTEETGLNEYLEARGHRVIETDLGEYIIQLAGEAPSHIIVPAIHKSRDEIGELFARTLDVEHSRDPVQLTGVARQRLRDEFARADMGISGANFAIAETGSFLVLENEGNARLCTSLPKVHVALIGIEKVIPKLTDLDTFLRLLPRSGTGQRLTSYQTIFTGPRVEGREGPEELHVVLLDNGRNTMLKDSLSREALACIRCGACLNVCPVYGEIGGHAYASVYPGPIGSVITPMLRGGDAAHQLPFASSLCGSCRDVCPVGIDLPALLLRLRSEIKSGDGPGSSKLERSGFGVWAFLMSGPKRYACLQWLLQLSRPFLRWPATRALLSRLVPPLAAWTAARDLRPPAQRSFRQLWQAQEESRP